MKAFFCLLMLALSIQLNSQEINKKTITMKNGNSYTYLDEVDYQINRPQRSIMWDEPQRISDYINEDSWSPSITMSPDGTLHAVFCETIPDLYPAYQRIVYRSKSTNGIWSEPIIVDEFSGIPPSSNHDPSIAVSNNGDIHIVFHYFNTEVYLKQVAYTKYDFNNNIWTTEIISGDSASIQLSFEAYPRIIIVNGNPVVTWGVDKRNGTNESYVVYHNAQGWSDPILLSSIEPNKSGWPIPAKMSSDSVFIPFIEYNNTHDSVAVYYRILSINDGTLSEIFKIKGTQRHISRNDYNIFRFDVCSLNQEQIFLTLNSKDTLYTYNFNISNQTIVRNPEVLVSNVSSPTNYNLPSICADSYNKIHIVYTVWNALDLYYVTYDNNEGFSQPIRLTTNSTCYNFPQVIFGTDGYLHLVYADNILDSNADDFFDREIFYTKEDISSGNEMIEETVSNSCYPNPTIDKLEVYISKIISEIVIFDIEGRIIDSFTNINSNHFTINLSSKPNGIYLAKIVSDKTVVTQKFIIK